MSKLQKKPSALKREHPGLQLFSILLGHFFPPGSGYNPEPQELGLLKTFFRWRKMSNVQEHVGKNWQGLRR
jgi:hypothetical protein